MENGPLEAAAASPRSGQPQPAREPAGTADATWPFQGFVVGVGASAGGLDALERLFQALPSDSGAAFVVVQHLSPDHKSMMDNLLARYTAMPVRVAEHDMPLAANSVFLIPPARTMRLAGDRLQLSPKPDHGLVLPIDIFFASIAEQCADRALAVVLSGTGSDGSRGVVAVNAGGGFVFVQEPSTARFDGMPRSAVATGLADVVAPAEDLAARLAAHLRAPRNSALHGGGHEAVLSITQPLDGVLSVLLASSGINFHDYKPTTVLRRIERRMQVQRTPTMGQYLALLEGSTDEQVLLRRELLIPVTRFFRDGEAFEQLAADVVPALVQSGSPMDAIRVWVAACSTGEEAYSIAIVFAEAFERLGRSRPVKIFATDVEPQHLEVAAAGQYPDTIAAEVSGARLERWFVERQGGWAVRPEIRQMVIFARHNLVADPPFTRMDLVTCRNALIYFQPAAQELALRRLQYALLTGGHLLLGPSESLGVLHRDFNTLPGRFKLYRLLRHDRQAVPAAAPRHASTLGRESFRRSAASASQPLVTPVQQGDKLLQQHYLPPTLLVGPGRELLHVYGSARELLSIGEGQPTLDVLKLLPRELAWPTGLLLQTVGAGGQPFSAAPVQLGEGAQAQRLRLVARRLNLGADDGHVLLSFEPAGAEQAPGSADTAAEAAALDAEQQRRVELLERELDLTQHSLQSTIEELETANEELQATNEELMASNEELQSTNEELQSVNEELYTVNSEYQEKVDVLNGINADLENISKATAIPTLFVDEALRLTRFTTELSRLFKVRESDRGRSIEDFAHLLDYPELYDDLRQTLAGSQSAEREVQSRDGTWWLARIQPYVARSASSTRAVMTFFEVTSVKDSQRLQAVIDSLVEHVAVLDARGTITMVNGAWRAFAAANGDAAMAFSGPGSNYLQVCAGAALDDHGARAAHDGLADVLQGRRPQFTLRYPCHSGERKLWFVMHVAPVRHPGGGVVVSHVDVTDWVQRSDAPAH